jgi:tetratricopeptide (TPR) repeat protein
MAAGLHQSAPEIRHSALGVAALATALCFCAPAARAQFSGANDSGSLLQQHYDSAQNFQTSGDLPEAANQYKLFLSSALVQLAYNRAKAGDFPKASQFFDAAVALVPADLKLQLDYAEAALSAHDLAKARALSQTVVDADPKNAKAHRILGRALIEQKELPAARIQLENAVALEPDFDNGYALASADLAAKDEKSAAKVFGEMLAAFGDSAPLRMSFGRAYAQYGYPEQAIVEFKKAIAKDPKTPGAHYSLGASYVLSLGEINFPLAIAEFQKELANNPNDYYSHSQLGYIDLSQHKLDEAVVELSKATTLNPADPDAFLSLGQAYFELNRFPEAEAALRKSIALTNDPSRNHYQVQRAHYLLGRVLLQSDHADEAKSEMAISQDLSRRSVQENQGKSADNSSTAPNSAAQDTASSRAAASASFKSAGDTAAAPDAVKHAAEYEAQLAGPIADSYNNLGVISAGDKDYTTALTYFEQAHQWNPALDTLDFNWGRAAFSARRFDDAIPPLTRYIAAHPNDAGAHITLGLSYFLLKNYKDALAAFQPVESKLDSTPALTFAYAVCQTKAGDYEKGLATLRQLTAAHPEIPDNHKALAEAYAARNNFSDAAAELREALKLNPSDAEASAELQQYESKSAAQSPAPSASKPN